MSRPKTRRVLHLASLASTLALAFGLAGPPGASADELAPGAPAPPFELLGSDGHTYTLERFAGRQAVVLAWFPKAFTPG